VKSVKNRILEDGYGYVRISQFQARTGDNLEEAIDELQDEAGGELRGLVLDLRNNPGGVLSAAVDVSDAFLEKGMIVYTEGRTNESEIEFKATPRDVLEGAPMVVLVNVGSASASEIVAGALQDHHRAVVMGQKTFGKGSVQTILPLKDGSAIKLTTARYFTPSGRSIQAEGIVPDITLEQVTVTAAEGLEFEPVTESNLTGHLNNGSGLPEEPVVGDEPAAGDGKEVTASLASQDYQLYEALNLLKGLHILRQTQH